MFIASVPAELFVLMVVGLALILVAWIRNMSDTIEGEGEERWRFRR